MKKLLILAIMLSSFVVVNAIKVHSAGNLVFLNGVSTVNVRFTYDNMIVNGMTETDYVKKKVSEYNAQKPGRGDEFAKTWETNKQHVYPNHFIELFEKNCDMVNNNFFEQKYSIIVNTNFFDPGLHAGVGHKTAEISVVVRIVETAYPDKVLGEITILNSSGHAGLGHEFDAASRVAEAYAKAGRECGKIIKEACK